MYLDRWHVTRIIYPRESVARLCIQLELPFCFRIFLSRYLSTPLGVGMANTRFYPRTSSFSALYMAPAFATAFLEAVVRDRLVGIPGGHMNLDLISDRAWALISSIPGEMLRMLDLRGNRCFNLRAPTDAVKASDHAAGQALGRSIYFEHEYVDGIIFASRLNGQDVYVIFDRAIPKLLSLDFGFLAGHSQLEATLSEHSIRLVNSAAINPRGRKE